MERYAKLASDTNTVNDYWCAIATRSELSCLDIAGPSTLGNSLNTTSFDLTSDTVFTNGLFIRDIYSSSDNSSVNLFGQYDKCDGKVVGDGVINVFDIATLIAYIFKDYEYANLNPNPEQVFTVEGRDRLTEQCGTTHSRVDYMSSYASDTCVFFDDGCYGSLRFETGCGNEASEDMYKQEHPYSGSLSPETKRQICAFECEVRNCVNFEIQNNMCLTFMSICTDAGYEGGDLRKVFKATYSCNHAYLPSPPPPPSLPSSTRRTLGDSTAESMWSRWKSLPLLTPSSSPITTRSWLPIIGARHDVVRVPVRQLSQAHHSMYPDHDYDNGRWYTLRTASVSLRLHAVLTGLPGDQSTAKLSYRAYDGYPPEDPTQREVRYTRYCEFGRCDDTCASIETAHPSRVALQQNTLELIQRPIRRACPFETHIWVPFAMGRDRCVGLEYLVVSDGIRGQFARDTACVRHLMSPPPPSPIYVGLPRPPPSPHTPNVTYMPSMSPSISNPPPPPKYNKPNDKSWVWIVSVTVIVLGCGCCCVSIIVTLRRKKKSDKDGRRIEDEVTLRKRSVDNGLEMGGRRDVEALGIHSIPIQANRYPVNGRARTDPRDGQGLGNRKPYTRPIA